jgi:hypothetical protein
MAAKLKIEKRRDEIKKKNCSPLKLLSQSQPKGHFGRRAGQIFGREPSNDYFINI